MDVRRVKPDRERGEQSQLSVGRGCHQGNWEGQCNAEGTEGTCTRLRGLNKEAVSREGC